MACDGWDIEPACLRIKRRAPPVAAASPSRHVDCSFLGRRRENRPVVELVEYFGRLAVKLRSEVDQVFLCRPLQLKGCGLRRERLRGGRAFPWNRCLGNGPHFDGPDRLAGDSVEDETESGLSDLRHGFDGLAIDLDIAQDRRSRQVVIPQAMMDRLVMPDPLTGFGFKTDERLGEKGVAQPVGAVPVVGGSAGRNVEVSQFFVSAHDRPWIRGPGVFPRVVFPGLVAEFAGLRNRMKGPCGLAGANIECTNITARRLLFHWRIAY